MTNKLKQIIITPGIFLNNKELWVLLFILGLGAYFRFWNIQHLFNIIGDYDEGVYALGSRMMSQGYLPYRDFTLVHPPLYNLLLAAIYKIFGYSFFYGKYLSAVCSLASVILIYLTGKKIANSSIGLLAAALFAISPDMVFAGRRIVQEALGVFFVTLAIYFVADYLTVDKRNRLLFAGLALGLAVATKYTFIPAVIAVYISIIFILMSQRFSDSLKRLARPCYLVCYVAFLICIYAMLFIFNYLTDLSVPIPFFNNLEFSLLNLFLIIVIFGIPFILTVLLMGKQLHLQEWLIEIRKALSRREVWYCIGGTVIGYFLITGYFWVRTPQEFIHQTILLQNARNTYFPSLVTIIQYAIADGTFVKIVYFPIMVAIPLALILLNKIDIDRPNIFISISLLITVLFCLYFYPTPRYYIAVYPFVILGLSIVTPLNVQVFSANIKSLPSSIKAGLLSIVAILLLFLSISTVLLTNYAVYDIAGDWFMYDEEQVYMETGDYLESQSPNLVYAVNPIFTAMDDRIPSTEDFDTFGLLYLNKDNPEQIIKNKIAEGVDYIIVDPWIKVLSGQYIEEANGLVKAIKEHGSLIMVIHPDCVNRTEIYKMKN